MAKLIVEAVALDDHGHFGSTYYWCSNCDKDCGNDMDICPHCGVEFDEANEFKGTGYPFGGSDFPM